MLAQKLVDFLLVKYASHNKHIAFTAFVLIQTAGTVVAIGQCVGVFDDMFDIISINQHNKFQIILEKICFYLNSDTITKKKIKNIGRKCGKQN